MANFKDEQVTFFQNLGLTFHNSKKSDKLKKKIHGTLFLDSFVYKSTERKKKKKNNSVAGNFQYTVLQQNHLTIDYHWQ